jgi:peptidoglycan/xylan/chitin deacetylase (PgdA/CDA1 family)
MRVLVRGGNVQKQIALTFDDGPHPGYTDRLLDVLGRLDVPATHFLVGRNVRKEPGLTRRIAAEGHEIGNHSENHIRLDAVETKRMPREIAACSEAIEEAAGVRPAFFRPPGGWNDTLVVDVANALGMTVAMWTLSAGDYTSKRGEPTAKEIADRVVAGARPGSVVILHDPMPATLEALPDLVPRLRAKGFTFVRLSELARAPGASGSSAPRTAAQAAQPVKALSPGA